MAEVRGMETAYLYAPLNTLLSDIYSSFNETE
jgi:hypothetical protein